VYQRCRHTHATDQPTWPIRPTQPPTWPIRPTPPTHL